MGAGDLVKVQSAASGALALLESLKTSRDNQTFCERRINQALADTGRKLAETRAQQARAEIVLRGVENIEAQAVNCVIAHIRELSTRLAHLQTRGMSPAVATTLGMLGLQLEGLDADVVALGRYPPVGGVIDALRGKPAEACKFVSAALYSFEDADRRARRFTGGPRDWFVAIVGGLIVGLLMWMAEPMLHSFRSDNQIATSPSAKAAAGPTSTPVRGVPRGR